jgi:hypothetical protein
MVLDWRAICGTRHLGFSASRPSVINEDPAPRYGHFPALSREAQGGSNRAGQGQGHTRNAGACYRTAIGRKLRSAAWKGIYRFHLKR